MKNAKKEMLNMVMTSAMYHILFEPAKASEYKIVKNGIVQINEAKSKKGVKKTKG